MDLNKVNIDRTNDYKYLYSRMFPYAKPYLFRGILGILIAIPAGLLDGVMPFALQIFLDNVVPSKDMNLALLLSGGIFAFAIIQGVLRYISNYLNTWAGRKTTNAVKIDLFRKLVRFESKFYDTNNSGLIMSRFNSDSDGASSGLLENFKKILTQACSMTAYIFILLYTSWQLAIIAITALVLAVLPVMFIKKKIKYISNEFMKLAGKFVCTFNETVQGNKIVTSYNLQKNQSDEFEDRVHEGFNLGMSLTKTINWLSPAQHLISSLGFAIVIVFASHLLFNGELSIGKLTAFAGALLLLYKPIKTIGNTLAGMQSSFESMNRVIELLDLDSQIKDKPDAVKIDSINESITLENVGFEYEEGQPVLKDINLNVKKGEVIALVGNSGGGKSTFASLVPRFYEVTQGAIKIDGINIKDITLESLRANISVVFQDNYLFSGSIKHNIMQGNFNATNQDFVRAINDSYLNEFIDSLPEGVDTDVKERGTRLSGGQKQRVAIARALIKNAPIVILDEATSALDNKSEAIVQKAINKLMENRTVFVIAHRLSTITNADRIVVINEGRIIEIGSHDELIVKDGAYKSLYDAQFKEKQIQEKVVKS